MTLTVAKRLALGFAGSLLITLLCVAVSFSDAGTYFGRLASDFDEVVNGNVRISTTAPTGSSIRSVVFQAPYASKTADEGKQLQSLGQELDQAIRPTVSDPAQIAVRDDFLQRPARTGPEPSPFMMIRRIA